MAHLVNTKLPLQFTTEPHRLYSNFSSTDSPHICPNCPWERSSDKLITLCRYTWSHDQEWVEWSMHAV